MSNFKIAYKILYKIYSVENIMLLINFITKLAKIKNLISKVQKYHLINKNHIKIENIKLTKIKRYQKPLFIFGMINILILFILFNAISNMNDIIMKSSYISLKINGPGIKTVTSNIISPSCYPRYKQPDEIYINNIKQERVSNYYNFNDTENEVKLVWNEPVTSCNCLFLKCTDIKEIDFSYFDSSKTTSMFAIFYESNGLTSINLSNLNTSLVRNMNCMFDNCYNLNSIDLSSFDTTKVIDFSLMFYGCKTLIFLNLSNFDTSQVKNMKGMFYECSSLKSIILSNFETSKVEDMSYMFWECSSLNNLDVSNFNTSRVKNMYGMFYICSSLESINLSNFDASQVTDMGFMLFRCLSLNSLDISNFKTSQVTKMENMFEWCISLTSLDLSNFDTSKVQIMYRTFFSCTSLKYLNISNFNTSNVETMYAMFYQCYSLTSLDVSNFDTLKVTNMDYIFGSCESLTSINVSSFNTKNLLSMEGIFSKCSSLTSIDLSNFETSKSTSMEVMFRGCSKLKIINISNFNTSQVTNMDQMFYNCTNLEYINLKNATIQSIETTMNNIFSLTQINLVVCTDDEILISKILENQCAIIDCSDNWRENRKKIIAENNTCVDSCSLVYDTFEYDSKCYQNCPYGSYKYIYFDSENDFNINCTYSLEGYYFDEQDLFYKHCYSSCKSCNKGGNEIYHNCLECNDNYRYQIEHSNYSNCYSNCSFYYYYNNITKSYHCTEELKCPMNYNKLIFDKKECIDDCRNDIEYKYNYLNQCYIECPNGTLNDTYYCINKIIDEISSEENSDIIISNIIYNNISNIDEEIIISDNTITNIISDKLISYNNNSIFISNETINVFNDNININFHNDFNLSFNLKEINSDFFYEIQNSQLFAKFTSIDYFKYHKKANMTEINLGSCENKLKDAYNISYNDSLYILILEIPQEGMKIPIIEYGIYHLMDEDNLIQLDLTICKDTKIEISIPVSIEGNLDKYNSSSGYYNDLCYSAKSDCSTDICLND